MMDQSRNQTCDRYELKTYGNEEYDFHKKERKKNRGCPQLDFKKISTVDEGKHYN